MPYACAHTQTHVQNNRLSIIRLEKPIRGFFVVVVRGPNSCCCFGVILTIRLRLKLKPDKYIRYAGCCSNDSNVSNMGASLVRQKKRNKNKTTQKLWKKIKKTCTLVPIPFLSLLAWIVEIKLHIHGDALSHWNINHDFVSFLNYYLPHTAYIFTMLCT